MRNSNDGMVFWTVCLQNYIAMRNLKCTIQMMVPGPLFEYLNCAFQISHRDVILRTHGPKYSHSNDHSNCAIQITHHNFILRTHGQKYCHSNDHSNCALLLSCENSHRNSFTWCHSQLIMHTGTQPLSQLPLTTLVRLMKRHLRAMSATVHRLCDKNVQWVIGLCSFCRCTRWSHWSLVNEIGIKLSRSHARQKPFMYM